MRQPHARPDPPERPAREVLVEDLLGLVGVVLLFGLLFVIFPVLAS